MTGKREYWCATCGRWGSHDADHHDAWKQRSKEYFARKKRGNLALNNNNVTNNTDTITPESTPTPTVTPAPVASSNLSMLKRLVHFSDE
jgi:hypothetical protein